MSAQLQQRYDNERAAMITKEHLYKPNGVRRIGSAIVGELRRFTRKGDAMVWLEVGRWDIAPPAEFEPVEEKQDEKHKS